MSEQAAAAVSSNNNKSEGQRKGRGGGGNRRRGQGGNDRNRPQQRNRRTPPASEVSMDSQMIEYWAKSEDPALRERAEKMRLEHKTLVEKKKQEQLDDEMKAYWKRAKTDREEEGEAATTAAVEEAQKTE